MFIGLVTPQVRWTSGFCSICLTLRAPTNVAQRTVRSAEATAIT